MKEIALSICIPLYKPNLKHLMSLLLSIEGISKSIKLEAVFSFDGDQPSSTEEACVLISKFSNVESRVLHQFPRIGMVRNWNATVEAARGEFFLLMGQDDVVDSENVPIFLDHMTQSQSDLLFGRERYISGVGEELVDPRKSFKPEELPLDEIERYKTGLVTKLSLLYGNVFADPCSAIVRRSAHQQLGGYSTCFSHAADLEFWLRLDNHGLKIDRLNVFLASRRIHRDSATTGHVALGVANSDRLSLFRKYSQKDDAYFFNRSLARLWTHWMHDLLACRKAFERPEMHFIGGTRVILKAVLSEALETLRIQSPRRDFRRLVSNSLLEPDHGVD